MVTDAAAAAKAAFCVDTCCILATDVHGTFVHVYNT